MTITTTVPAGSHRAAGLPPGLDRNAFPDERAVQQMQAGLEQGIQKGDHGSLRTAVTQFRDVFPKLPVWERFKDFFGLSETADNRRDAAALCIMGAFYNRVAPAMEPETYNQTVMTLAQILQETGLAPERGYTELESLTADITARLLAQTLGPMGFITLDGGEMMTTPETGDVFLTGQVSFRNAANTPELLRNLSLPFVATVVSPLNVVAKLIGGGEDATTLRTLFGALAPETRVALQQRYEQHEGRRQVLFSRDGVLGELSQLEVPETASSPGQPSVPAEWTGHDEGYVGFAYESGTEFVRSGLAAIRGLPSQKVANVKDLHELLIASLNSQTQVENFNTTTGIRMDGYVCHHDFLGPAENCLLVDLHRGGLSNAIVVVNGDTLSPLVTHAMQSVALKVYEKGNATATDLIAAGELWAREIQKNTGIDEITSQTAAAAVMYTICQQGAGRGCHGALSVGPRYDLRACLDSQDVLHINTQPGGAGTSVTLATISSGLSQVGFFGRAAPGAAPEPDFRASGVSYTLPASTAPTAAGMAASFMRNDIHVEGFGVRYPKAPSPGAQDPLPSPEGWAGPWVLTPEQQATLDAERGQGGVNA